MDYSKYATEMETSGAQYPAIQATVYQPSGGSSVGLCTAIENLDLTSNGSGFFGEIKKRQYGSNNPIMADICSDVRFVILGVPRIQMWDKRNDTYHPLERGAISVGGDMRTATRLAVSLYKDGDFLRDTEGSPLVFTLKLLGARTDMIKGKRDRTVLSLNEDIAKRISLSKSQFCLHMACVELKAEPQLMGSTIKSWGVNYYLGSAKILPDSLIEEAFAMASSEEVIDFLKDPFGVARGGQDEESE